MGCSGGADSSALVLALADATDDLVVAHVVHDLRPREQALADRNAVRELARSLNLPFAEAEVCVTGTVAANRSTNLEARAREARYAALARIANVHRAKYVAVAHHADDQLETVLMALLRGSGARGLAGAAAKRRLEPGIWLIRPMLEGGLGRGDAERICAGRGWEWREDLTNRDTSRLRAAVRHKVLPLLEQLRPGVSRRVALSAGHMRGLSRLLNTATDQLWLARTEHGGEVSWPRKLLRAQAEVVVGDLLRKACSEVAGAKGADARGARAVGPAVRAVRDRGTDPREFRLAGATVAVDSRHVRVKAGI